MTQPADKPLTHCVDYENEGFYIKDGPFADLDAAKAAAIRASTKHMHAHVIISQGKQHVRFIHFKNGKEQIDGMEKLDAKIGSIPVSTSVRPEHPLPSERDARLRPVMKWALVPIAFLLGVAALATSGAAGAFHERGADELYGFTRIISVLFATASLTLSYIAGQLS